MEVFVPIRNSSFVICFCVSSGCANTSIETIKRKLEIQMDAIETGNRRFETLAWGLLFVWLGAWWGFLEDGILPAGSGAMGVGLILLGLNVARWLKDIPITVLSTTFGALFLLLGLMKLTDVARRCPMCNVNLFALFLILLGGIVLVREFLRVRETSAQ